MLQGKSRQSRPLALCSLVGKDEGQALPLAAPTLSGLTETSSPRPTPRVEPCAN